MVRPEVSKKFGWIFSARGRKYFIALKNLPQMNFYALLNCFATMVAMPNSSPQTPDALIFTPLTQFLVARPCDAAKPGYAQ
jgi:hypothetical protein